VRLVYQIDGMRFAEPRSLAENRFAVNLYGTKRVLHGDSALFRWIGMRALAAPLLIFQSMGLMLVARTRTSTSLSPHFGISVSSYRIAPDRRMHTTKQPSYLAPNEITTLR
jgi:hypothetical protein